MSVHQALTAFIDKYCSQVDESQLQTEFDPRWPSPCLSDDAGKEGEMVSWRPVMQSPEQSFENIETALELAIHHDVKAFYTCFWSDNLAALAKEGKCELLQPWNEEDFVRLQENLVGHVLMKRRLGQDITLFIGLTDEDDFILTVNNDTGAVMLEQVGCEPSRQLASDLTEFINSLEPLS